MENFYDQVVDDGIVIINDYERFEGCRQATDEFMAQRGISDALRLKPWIHFRKLRLRP